MNFIFYMTNMKIINCELVGRRDEFPSKVWGLWIDAAEEFIEDYYIIESQSLLFGPKIEKPSIE